MSDLYRDIVAGLQGDRSFRAHRMRLALPSNATYEFGQMILALGFDYASWPVPARRKPSLWHVTQRLDERRLLKALRPLGIESFTPDMRAAYWRERDLGKATDDTGGFICRCWEAALRARAAADLQDDFYVAAAATGSLSTEQFALLDDGPERLRESGLD